VEDALRRRVHRMHASTIRMHVYNFKDEILEVVKSNQQYVQAKEALQQGKIQHKFKYYALKEDGVLMYKGKVFVPNSREMKSILLREMHNMPYARHPGYQKTIAAVRGQYFWPGMKKDVVGYISKWMES
jgi:hypothetical protein